MHLNQCSCFKNDNAFKFMTNCIWTDECNQSSHAEVPLVHCCHHHHHHHNQLLGEANFVNQRAACHLFSGHFELWQKQNHKSSQRSYSVSRWVCVLCDTSRWGCFFTTLSDFSPVICTHRPCVLVKKGLKLPLWLNNLCSVMKCGRHSDP